MASASGNVLQEVCPVCCGTGRLLQDDCPLCSNTSERGSHLTGPSNLIEALHERGLLQQFSWGDSDDPDIRAQRLHTGPLSDPALTKKIYMGFDPTADSLHLGNLMGLIVLRWCQLFGHTPVCVIGGATACIGDPSGKSKERPLLSIEEIEQNKKGLLCNFKQILDFDGDNAAEVVDNMEWFGEMGVMEFLRDVGKRANVRSMLRKTSVAKRLESGNLFSFTEFSYQLLQGWDFVQLHKRCGVTVQAGGSDQWGNMLAGSELSTSPEELLCFTFPLLLKSDGTKFGKSESGAVWLSPEKLSPFGFFQFLRSVDDDLAVKLLKLLTFMPLGQIEELVASMDSTPNGVQRVLAEQVTLIVHGEQALREALAVTEILFAENQGDDDGQLSFDALNSIARDALLGDRHWRICRVDLEGRSILDVAVESRLFSVRGKPAPAKHIEALAKQPKSGVRWNGKPVSDVGRTLQIDVDFFGGRFALLGSGPRRKCLIEAVDA